MANEKARSDTNGIKNPHISIFKQFLTYPDTTQDFMQLYLPAELQAICDFRTLKLEPGDFTEDSSNVSNILYSLKTTTGDDSYILIEHVSAPERHIVPQVFRYILTTMQRHLDAGNKKLPLVIPIVFYTGNCSPYPYSTCWLDEFCNPELAKKIYSNNFALIDITVIPDKEIMEHRRMAALVLLLKHIHIRSLTGVLDNLAPLLLAENITGQQLSLLINYLISVDESLTDNNNNR